jgi:hypothetical protein
MKTFSVMILFLLPLLAFADSATLETFESKSSHIFLDHIKKKFLKSDISKIKKRMISEIKEYIPKKTKSDIETEKSVPCHKTIHDVIKNRFRSDRCSTAIYKSPKILEFSIKEKLCPIKTVTLSGNAFIGGELRGLMNHEGNELLLLWFLDAC